jgi:hypothetical protein
MVVHSMMNSVGMKSDWSLERRAVVDMLASRACGVPGARVARHALVASPC